MINTKLYILVDKSVSICCMYQTRTVIYLYFVVLIFFAIHLHQTRDVLAS